MRHTGGGRITEGETEMALEHAQPLGPAGVSDAATSPTLSAKACLWAQGVGTVPPGH